MIPGLDGHEVYRLLKRERTTRHIPVPIITTRDTAEERALAKEDQADGFWAKPVTMEEILTAPRHLRGT